MKTDIESKEQIKEQIKEQSKEQSKEQIKEQSKVPKKELKKEIKEKRVSNEHQSIIKNFIGKEIAITLRNGNKIKGKLETVVQYELVITVAYNPIVVMKHAVDYIELAGEK